jgi:hypothetical protein
VAGLLWQEKFLSSARAPDQLLSIPASLCQKTEGWRAGASWRAGEWVRVVLLVSASADEGEDVLAEVSEAFLADTAAAEQGGGGEWLFAGD